MRFGDVNIGIGCLSEGHRSRRRSKVLVSLTKRALKWTNIIGSVGYRRRRRRRAYSDTPYLRVV